jgi:hypothetical protein
MNEVQYMDFITTARAKGLKEASVVSRHILRNALLPAITLFTGFLPALVGGALVIEVIFAIPGAGRLLVEAVLARDYPVILGIVMVIAFVKIIAHIVADLLFQKTYSRFPEKQVICTVCWIFAAVYVVCPPGRQFAAPLPARAIRLTAYLPASFSIQQPCFRNTFSLAGNRSAGPRCTI